MIFNHSEVELSANNDETVLDLLLRHQLRISHSCKSGHCQTCLLKSVSGDIKSAAQKDLKETAIKNNYFMACQQPANTIQSAVSIDYKTLFVQAELIQKHYYTEQLCQLKLKPQQDIEYRAGQFINVRNPDGCIRSYSIASVYGQNDHLELHVQRKTGGSMTEWIFDSFSQGDTIDIQGPIGECFYSCEADSLAELVFIGNATGAAPLLGICRDALQAGHQGKIKFYHGARERAALYLDKLLKQTQANYEQLEYIPCINSDKPDEGIRQGRCNEIALSELNIAPSTKVYICGNPDMVAATKKKVFLAGIASKNIFVDPFEYKDLRLKPR